MPGDSRSEDRSGVDGRAGRLRARARAAPRAGALRLRAALARAPETTARVWRVLGLEQKAIAVGAVLLALSTLGPFSWVEAAQLLVAGALLTLLKQRAERAPFHLPFGDGVVVATAGAWAGALVLLRLPSRPLGQGLLALACALLILLAGLRERMTRPPDDLPTWDFPPRRAPTERL